MKLTFALMSAVLAASVSSVPMKRDVDPSLVPDFGHAANVNPTGTGDCDGAVNGTNGQPVKVPCSCPPDRNSFIQSLNANVNAGHAVNNPSIPVTFPTGQDSASKVARIQASLVTLQNLNGPGKGCPAASTTLVAQQAALQKRVFEEFTFSKRDVDPALVPDFGHAAGVNPTGTGDCDGAVNGTDGQPIKVPCSCPPDRTSFIQKLNANVAAGHAINNPSVAVTFPTGQDNVSQVARIQASLVTLQNLNGPGQGCPAASTTFVAQQQALQRRGTVDFLY
ncbi:hypothetical protein PILCRDRAFT_810645 [Piloderma croceum F 1598]|uniref:Chorismate mutase domain-containing protein n=1 Tax=Piloderma croceum (strain F 1598) TaxID=765440 RepID=A0A0C3CNQ6_PILCF|nr:hypothetical protein PILCRDRAFT_810645 [Piloderma croceum F 1598]